MNLDRGHASKDIQDVSGSGSPRALGLSGETLEDLLRAMVTAGQATVLKVGGRITYRAVG